MIFPVVFFALFGVISCQYALDAAQYRNMPDMPDASGKNQEPQQRAILTANGIYPYGYQEPIPSRKIYVIRKVQSPPEIYAPPPVVSTFSAPSPVVSTFAAPPIAVSSYPTYSTYSNPALILGRNSNADDGAAPQEGRQFNFDSYGAPSGFMRNLAPQQMAQGFMDQPNMMAQI